ncbi:MAG: DUF938 domain-containing protein [Pseudomonadota bacterium]
MTDKTPKEIALETRATEADKLYSPSVARNREAIRAAFKAHMPAVGKVLEIASGTGEHAVHIAAACRDIDWRPGDPDAASRASIAAWTAATGHANLAPPHAIDAREPLWGVEDDAPFAGVISINMIHIAPRPAMEGLIAGAGRLLGKDGKLFLYGPFMREGAHTAPSNAAFDENLKSRDPSWGVRDLESEVVPLAANAGLTLDAVLEMPANNFSIVFKRS